MISIIIPIYKVENYIERCINSILYQNFKDYELILVDDCSPDNSIRKAEMILNNSKVSYKILHHEINKGLSVARNTGIKNARGKYLFFIDSDDCLTSFNSLKILMDKAIETNSDVTCGNFQRVYQDKTLPSIYNQREFYDKGNVIKAFCEGKIPVTAWNKLYKKDIFKNLTFKENILHEDELLIYQLIYRNYSFALTGEITYDYYINPQTIMTTYNYKRIESPVIIYEIIVDEYNKLNLNNDNLIKNIDHFAFKRYVSLYNPNLSNEKQLLLYKRIRNSQKKIKGVGVMRYLYHSHLFLPPNLGFKFMKFVAKKYNKSRNLI